ncbi:MAG: glycosyltransferase [Bacteroides sp.]|nr:glycosyltransferase [Bacteroides sp.]MCM1413241.1 glycosyltransferase [Bacteroides sp.]MCM1471449.1 glycosyltransferase [Bacteroides sp.]
MSINKIAVIITVFNRLEKTLKCLESLYTTHDSSGCTIEYEVYLTDDGSTDGTREELTKRNYPFKLHILQGTGSLFWNAGMNLAWESAIKHGGFDGYLWLNNDTIVLSDFWKSLEVTDVYSVEHYGKHGIYVGSTRDIDTKEFSYGGFNFVGRWRLKDVFIMPTQNEPAECQCGHGNITYVSAEVVEEMNVLYKGYFHGGGDHDYTYRAYKAGFPILVMPEYAGECTNDHLTDDSFYKMSTIQRIKHVSKGQLHNSLIFQRRCFPHRYPFVLVTTYLKALFPRSYRKAYDRIRR